MRETCYSLIKNDFRSAAEFSVRMAFRKPLRFSREIFYFASVPN